jgi:hypothetical protein
MSVNDRPRVVNQFNLAFRHEPIAIRVLVVVGTCHVDSGKQFVVVRGVTVWTTVMIGCHSEG